MRGKKKTKKKATRRKVATKKRAANPRARRTGPSYYQIFKCHGTNANMIHFLAMTTDGKIRWTSTRGDTVRWQSKAEATKIAKRLAKGRRLSGYHVGVVGSSTGIGTIATECRNAALGKA